MSPPRKPPGLTAERVASVLERDPLVEGGWRWRRRTASMFDGDETICASWNARWAGKAAGRLAKGLMRVKIDGRDFSFRYIEQELGQTIDAMVASAEGMPDDQSDLSSRGLLAGVIRAASRTSGLRLDDLTVLAIQNDPYRLDTPANHVVAKWFTGQLNELFPPPSIAHLRGLHYVLVSIGGVLKPDGSPYQNTLDDYLWMNEKAAKAARWLGYVGFERIKDQRNDAPVICRHPASSETSMARVFATFGSAWFRELGAPVEISSGQPWASLSRFGKQQPYCFAFFGEKSSLAEVLTPIAERYRANMYLCSGEISDTLVYEMARDADADGRPLIVFTFSDFDPAGWQMPVSIGRKLQALRDFRFPGLRAQVVPVSLTLEQVIAERLPTTMVKEKEGRRGRWDKEFGPALREAGLVTDGQPAQVEIDALASIRPDVLRRITLEKIALYWDATLERRTAASRAAWISSRRRRRLSPAPRRLRRSSSTALGSASIARTTKRSLSGGSTTSTRAMASVTARSARCTGCRAWGRTTSS
jgi:hypothetical protein